jgi:hypothetical protein
MAKKLDRQKVKEFFKAQRKEAFDYDVDGLSPYINEQSEDFIAALTDSANIISLLPVLEGIQSGEKIKLLDTDLPLQELEGCDIDDSGAVTFTNKQIDVKLLGSKQTWCNETLIGQWTQLLLKLPVMEQNEDLPIEDVIVAHLNMKASAALQQLVLFGDEDSLNPNLQAFDGHIKQIFEDADVQEVVESTAVDLNQRAYETAERFADARDENVRESSLTFEVWTSFANLDRIKKHLFDTKDYNALTMQVTQNETEYSLVLPVSGVKVRAIPQMSLAVTQWLGVIPQYMFIGTAALSDTDGLTKVPFLHNKVSYEIRYRAGVQHVMGQYFLKLATVS